jgi:hypothetical protein
LRFFVRFFVTLQVKQMRMAELVEMGRGNIEETDESLMRSERLVNDTIAIGAQTAETLQGQGDQLAKISEDLDEIHFSNQRHGRSSRISQRGWRPTGASSSSCCWWWLRSSSWSC